MEEIEIELRTSLSNTILIDYPNSLSFWNNRQFNKSYLLVFFLVSRVVLGMGFSLW